MRALNNITGALNRLGANAGKPAGLPGVLRNKFLFLWTGGYTGDDLKDSLGSAAVITVTGKDWTTRYIDPDTSATFAVPDNATFLGADGTDDFWFDASDTLQQKTHAELIASETLRTFIKYADFEPYFVYGIGILKAGETLTEADKVKLNRYFKLWAEYWGVLMDSGYMKDNRTVEESWSSYWLTRTPSTLALTNTGYPEGIKLDWLNGGAGYDGTSIERSTDGVTYAEVATVASGVVQYDSVSVASASGSFYYRVRCYKGTNYSPYSNVASMVAEAELALYVTGLTTALSEATLMNLNTFITSLKTGLSITDLDDAFDVIQLYAGETAESSLKNLVKDAHHATIVNAPSFVAFEGFSTDGTTQIINTQFIPKTNGLNFTLSSASAGIYTRTNNIINNLCGSRDNSTTNYLVLNLDNGSNNGAIGINESNAAALGSSINSLGFNIASRNSSNEVIAYRNKISSYSNSKTNTSLSSYVVYIGGVNTAGTTSNFVAGQFSCILLGRKFNITEVGVITDAIEAYMDSNGKGVIA